MADMDYAIGRQMAHDRNDSRKQVIVWWLGPNTWDFLMLFCPPFLVDITAALNSEGHGGKSVFELGGLRELDWSELV